MPKRTKIDCSPHRDRIVQWMRDHLTLVDIQRRCKEEFGLSLSVDTLSRYRDKLMPAQMLPAKYIQDKMKDVVYLTDELSRLSMLIIRQEERLLKLIAAENEAIEQGVILYVQQTGVSGETSEVARDYLQMLLKFVEVKQSLGLLEMTPHKLDIRGMILSGNVDNVEIPEEIRKMTDEELLEELNKEVIAVEEPK